MIIVEYSGREDGGLKHMPIEDHKNKNLKTSYLTGMFGVSMTGFTQEYFTPFLLLIGGSAGHVGVMSALTNFLSSFIQLASAGLTDHLRSRKRVVSIFIMLQALTTVFIFIMAAASFAGPVVFIALVALFTSFGAITHPGWISILSDLVPSERRGTYFGWRSRNLGFFVVGATLLAGSILYVFEESNVFYGFSVIFGIATVCRLLSWFSLKGIKEPPLTLDEKAYFSLADFLKQIRSSNFARFVFFVSAMNFSVNLAAPFFSVFMLRDLGFNYFLFTVVNTVAPITLYLSIRRWGLHADKVGNVKIIRMIAPLFSVIPLLWVLNQNPAFLIMAEIVSGFLWAGFNLCTSNFIMDAVSPQKRTRCIAYFSLLNGLALAAGALAGGFLVRFLPPVFGYNILSLFLLSSSLRLVVGIVLPKAINEVRSVESVDSQTLLFSMIGVKPIAGIERKTLQV